MGAPAAIGRRMSRPMTLGPLQPIGCKSSRPSDPVTQAPATHARSRCNLKSAGVRARGLRWPSEIADAADLFGDALGAVLDRAALEVDEPGVEGAAADDGAGVVPVAGAGRRRVPVAAIGGRGAGAFGAAGEVAAGEREARRVVDGTSGAR